ncbi:MAG: hypothetical protein R3C61_24565 [Bacteroidia bacterium]
MSAEDQYILSIEQLLRQISDLRRELEGEPGADRRRSVERSIRQREKRLERLIPYKFRIELRNICLNLGVTGDFLSQEFDS